MSEVRVPKLGPPQRLLRTLRIHAEGHSRSTDQWRGALEAASTQQERDDAARGLRNAASYVDLNKQLQRAAEGGQSSIDLWIRNALFAAQKGDPLALEYATVVELNPFE